MRYYNNKCDENNMDNNEMMDMIGMDIMGTDMMGKPMEMMEYPNESIGNQSNIPSPLPDELMLARAYVPFQQPGKTYSATEALHRGTIFPELDQPYVMGAEKNMDMDMKGKMMADKDMWRCSTHG